MFYDADFNNFIQQFIIANCSLCTQRAEVADEAINTNVRHYQTKGT